MVCEALQPPGLGVTVPAVSRGLPALSSAAGLHRLAAAEQLCTICSELLGSPLMRERGPNR